MLKAMFTCIFVLSFMVASLEACTGIRLTAKDSSIVSGRTLEFGTPIDMFAAVVPRGYSFTGKTPDGEGMVYKAKYAAMGIYCFNDQALMDGINEKGLVVGTFYFPGFAGYTSITKENQARALSPVDFPNWILSQFATLEEVKEALDSVVIAPTVIDSWGPEPAPFHYIVYDGKGNSLVIEPVSGELVTYENKIGCFTNSPTFDWHMTNLRNYINLTPFNHAPINLQGVNLAPFGQGSGMVGIPGDFTPPSRFVRAAIFSSTAVAVDNSKELISQAFHILNQFDIPIGTARQKEGGRVDTDYTMFTSVKDPGSISYYYRTYDDQNIKWMALKQFDLDAKAIKSMAVKGDQIGTDVSSLIR